MSTIGQIGETRLVDWLIKKFRVEDPDVVVENGNDAAVVKLYGNISLKVDTMVVEKIPRGIYYHDIGWKAIMACASDLAAIGSKPRYALLSISGPRSMSTKNFKEIFHGAREALSILKSSLLGGDLSETKELCLSVFMVGEVTNRPLLRYRAEPGDLIAVSREFGLEALGLRILFRKIRVEGSLAKKAIEKFKHPYAEVEYGALISSLGFVKSCSDSSDGLVLTIRQLIGNRADAVISDLPFSRELIGLDERIKKELTMYGGEEYALVYTYNPSKDPDLVSALRTIGRDRFIIGRVINGNGNVFLEEGSTLKKLKINGWRQFQSKPF
jgi:thiamine-monophosphate kinase